MTKESGLAEQNHCRAIELRPTEYTRDAYATVRGVRRDRRGSLSGGKGRARQDKNAFDVAGSAWACNKPYEARITIAVFRVEQFKRRGKIREKLVRSRNHDMVRGEH